MQSRGGENSRTVLTMLIGWSGLTGLRKRNGSCPPVPSSKVENAPRTMSSAATFTALLKAVAHLPQGSFRQLARAATRTVLPGGLAGVCKTAHSPASSRVAQDGMVRTRLRFAKERSWPSHAPVRGPQIRPVLDIEQHAVAYSRAPGFRAVTAGGVLGYSEPAHEIHRMRGHAWPGA